VIVRPLERRDIESIIAIQVASPEIAQWTMQDYEQVAAASLASVATNTDSSAFSGWVAERNGDISGFLIARHAANDVELLNVAVQLNARSIGIGASLLREMLAWSSMLKSENIFLEVRASNLTALRFYERHGFQATGRRQRYYAAPAEDALLLTLALK